jgi:hypothetical protein
MQARSALISVGTMAWGLVAIGCSPASEPSAVAYGSGQPIGHWAGEDTAGSTAAMATQGVPPGSGITSPTAPGAGIGGPAGTGSNGTIGQTGSAGTAAAGRTGSGGKTGGSGSGGMAASGSAGTGSGATPGGGVLSLAFDVTTSPVGMKYQPKNIGAIWIEDGNGKFVKSLEVWAQTRRRSLTNYLSSLAGASIDVTASATLGSHRTHHVTWNM